MKATRVQAIFISDNAQLVNASYFPNPAMSDAEKATYLAMLEAAAQAQQETGAPVEIYEMNLYEGLDVVYLERWGINRFPAVRLWAQYPDGREGSYDLESLTNAVQTSQTVEDMKSRLVALWRGEFGDQTLLCKYLPILCELGGWAWLAIAGVGAASAINTERPLKKAMWLGITGYAGYQFMKGGGFERLFKK